MADDNNHVVAFYNRHPISRDQILASLAATRGQLAQLAPEDLFPYDQDHYGGLEAVDALAHCAKIGPASRSPISAPGWPVRRAILPMRTVRR